MLTQVVLHTKVLSAQKALGGQLRQPFFNALALNALETSCRQEINTLLILCSKL